MIYSTLVIPSKHALKNAFEQLLSQAQQSLEKAGRDDPDQMRRNSGKALEKIVFQHLETLSKSTPFEGTLEETSVQAFPDIVAKGLYGVEVKSSFGDNWRTIGNSVNESTRIKGAETIYIMFGQLSDPISFKSRPYEECLSDIVVTHYPRYWIDMNLHDGQSIFDKMKIPYEDLRLKEDPFRSIRDYYRDIKKPGENLWWIDDQNANPKPLNPIVRRFGELRSEEREPIWAQAVILFPGIVSRGTPDKYDGIAGWLVVQHGMVTSSLRDLFSAGGQRVVSVRGTSKKLPAVFGRLIDAYDTIKKEITKLSEEELADYWDALRENRCKRCPSKNRRCQKCRSKDKRCGACEGKSTRCQSCRLNEWFQLLNHEIKSWNFEFDLDARDLFGAS
jgi:hypothetical protein